MQPRPAFFFAALIAAFCTPGLALGAEPPSLKPGLWEITRAGPPQQSERRQTATMCLDESVQAEMREFGMGVAKDLCTDNKRTFEANRLTVSAVCQMGPTKVTSRSVMTFTGNSSYHTEGSATYDPPMMNVSAAKFAVDAKWVGPCKPGQQPGDMTIDGGQTINVKSFMKK
jgi:Protein of unknown function (DUF3617)